MSAAGTWPSIVYPSTTAVWHEPRRSVGIRLERVRAGAQFAGGVEAVLVDVLEAVLAAVAVRVRGARHVVRHALGDLPAVAEPVAVGVR